MTKKTFDGYSIQELRGTARRLGLPIPPKSTGHTLLAAIREATKRP